MTLLSMPEQVTRRELALARVRRILSAAGVSEPPIDIERVARILGVRKIESAKLRRTDACLLPSRNGHTILVNEKSSRHRQRFSIAHEIGHLTLRANGIRFRGGSRRRTASEERLCDALAAELLMPEGLFEREMRHKAPAIHTIVELADIFDTATEPAAIRYGMLNDGAVQVVCWVKEQNDLRTKWVAGKRHISYGDRRSIRDMTCGPTQAYHAGGHVVVAYEAPKRSPSHLTLICESKSFDPGPFEYVLSVYRDERDFKYGDSI